MLALSDVLSAIRGYRSVLVTGPQRSGTTIAAHILSAELGLHYVDERDIAITDARLAEQWLKRGGVVIQCPALCYVADQFNPLLNYAVVLMRRRMADILASERRVNFRRDYQEGIRREEYKYSSRFAVHVEPPERLAAVKYECWDAYQKAHCAAFDLDYDSLRSHPWWTGERERFAIRQWRTGEDNTRYEPQTASV